MKYIPVEGKPDLVRDPHTGAIVNINKNDIRAARERKQKRKSQQAEFDQLKQDVDEIKQLLNKLVEKL